MANIYGALLGDLGVLAQSQQNAGQHSAAQMQQQSALSIQYSLAQQQALWNDSKIQNYGYLLINHNPPNIFIPITQEEVDMAEAWYEVDKIAPGIRSEE